MLRNWYRKGCLGMEFTQEIEEFNNSKNNIILDLSNEELENYAINFLGYKIEVNQRNLKGRKSIDLICKINNKIVVATAKFLIYEENCQNAEFKNVIDLLRSKMNPGVIKIAIIDGSFYQNPSSKKEEYTNKSLFDLFESYNIMSSLVLREFLYQL
jgi:hypothetical protein